MSYSTCPAWPAKWGSSWRGASDAKQPLVAFKVFRSQTYPSSFRNLLVRGHLFSKRYLNREKNKRLDASQKLPCKDKTCQHERSKLRKTFCEGLRILEEEIVNIREQDLVLLYQSNTLSLFRISLVVKPNLFCFLLRSSEQIPNSEKTKMIQGPFPIFVFGSQQMTNHQKPGIECFFFRCCLDGSYFFSRKCFYFLSSKQIPSSKNKWFKEYFQSFFFGS